MTIKQAMNTWGVSRATVLDRIKIIPGAEKPTFRWHVPDGIELPPITSHKAYLLMIYLTVFNEGGRPNLSRTGLKALDIEPGYKYLQDMGYITGRPGEITSFGKKLMRKLETEKKTKAYGELNTGVIKAGVEREL